jgi:hypothetical protein
VWGFRAWAAKLKRLTQFYWTFVAELLDILEPNYLMQVSTQDWIQMVPGFIYLHGEEQEL